MRGSYIIRRKGARENLEFKEEKERHYYLSSIETQRVRTERGGFKRKESFGSKKKVKRFII